MVRGHKDPSVHRDCKESRDQKDLPEYKDPLDHKEREVLPDKKEMWGHQVPLAPQLRGEQEQEETHHQILMSLLLLACRGRKESRVCQVSQVLQDNKVNQDHQE